MSCVRTVSIVVVLALAGCTFGNAVNMVAIKPSPDAGPLSEAEIAAAVAGVTKVALSFGLQPSPQLDYLRKTSEEETYWDYRVVAAFVPVPEPFFKTRYRPSASVSVTVGVKKGSGQLVIRILDIDSMCETDFAHQLEDALVRELPSYRFEFERTRGPLFLGP